MSQEPKPFRLPAGLEKSILGRHLKALETANEELRRQIEGRRTKEASDV